MLLPHIAQFQNIKQLQIETHTVEDDTSLAEFITSCQALEVLTIMHARRVEYTTESDEEDESDDEEDLEAGWDTDSDCHYTTSIAAFPSLFRAILPSLANLRHLALHRLDLGVPDDLLDTVSNLARLVNLNISFCSLSGRSLAFLLEGSKE